eukprot:2035554-Rhodomonas_salina.1
MRTRASSWTVITSDWLEPGTCCERVPPGPSRDCKPRISPSVSSALTDLGGLVSGSPSEHLGAPPAHPGPHKAMSVPTIQ